jgi:ribosomal protein S18 acetylase RimI-like enzyme
VAVVELRDKDVIAGFCRRNAALHAYELGDLDDFFWPHTRWFAWRPDGDVRELVLLYTEPDPPVLIALSDRRDGELERLLASLLAELPPRVYAHLAPHLAGVLTERYASAAPATHLKMHLVRAEQLEGHQAAVEVLVPDDLAAVETFYRAAYPGTWFTPRMLETMRYVGIRESGRLTSVAGVHVYSPAWGVAALGNVATLPSHRRQGLAQAACASLCQLLRADGIDTIALNVRSDNVAAIRAYERLGFDPVAEYVETTLEARDASVAGDVSAT